MKKEKLLKIISLIVLIGLTIWLFVAFRGVDIKKVVGSYGAFAPIIYILLWVTLPVGFFPVPVLALAGGAAFGLIKGSIYTLIGASGNMIIMFVVARYLARESARKMVFGKFKKLDQFINDSSERRNLTLLICRLIPLIPYNIINYGFGLTDMSIISYTLISVIGIIPGTFVFINMGDKSSDIWSKDFLFSVLILIALIVVSSLAARKIKRKEK